MSAPRVFIEFRPAMRTRIADAVESLLLLLDEIDGDADLEEEPDLENGFDQEQDLGAAGDINQEKAWRSNASGTGTLEFEGDTVAECDREADDHAEHGGDDEPTLGATTAMNQGRAWQVETFRCDESEPSLGWTGIGRGHPETATRGYDDDREGLGDIDGVVEQGLHWNERAERRSEK